MENLRIFLESSTIHGLAYISSAKKWMKVFWIIIVTSGFIGSGVMIFESFQIWKESPIKTTLETLPITEITLPKVIVCPPKNTFTNLNFGLRMLSNMTLDNDTRNDLTYHALHQIQDYHYREVLSNVSLSVFSYVCNFRCLINMSMFEHVWLAFNPEGPPPEDLRMELIEVISRIYYCKK